MPSAAFRLVRRAALAAVMSVVARAAPLPLTRFYGVDYVSAIDAAAHLDARLRWSAGGRSLALVDRNHRLEMSAEGREIDADGLRVYLGDAVISRGGRFYISRTDFERRLTPLLRPALCGTPPRHPLVIAIDPGHGGIDHGAENPRLRLMEKTGAYDVGLRCKQLLEAAGYRVVLTRTSDTKIELPVRGLIANQAGADLFVSIHFNSLPGDNRTHGTEIYTFPPAGQRSTVSWSRGGKDDAERTPSPENRMDCWSVVLSHSVHRELLRSLHTTDRGEKLMHLAVLRVLNCPGILIESAFISQDGEAARIATPAFRQSIAEGVVAGIRAYAAALDAVRPVQPHLAAGPAMVPTLAPPKRPAR